MKQINESKNSKKANFTINKVYEEIKYAESYAKKLNLSWTESYSEVYSMDLYYLNKEDHRKLKELQKRYQNQYDLYNFNLDKRTGQPLKTVILYDEDNNIYNCEFAEIHWNVTNNTKTNRSFLFKNNGDIKYTQSKNKQPKLEYTSIYNVNSNDLHISFNLDNEKLQASIYDNIQIITYNNYTIEINLVDGSKKISYQSDKHQNKSIFTEIVLYKDGNIKSKLIEIKNYDYNNQVKNTYQLKFKKDKLIESTHINEEAKEFDMLTNQELTELSNILLSEVSKSCPLINMNNKELEELINSIKEKLFSMIKQIKGDVPLQGLSNRLDITLAKINSKKETNEKNKTRKKEQPKKKK